MSHLEQMVDTHSATMEKEQACLDGLEDIFDAVVVLEFSNTPGNKGRVAASILTKSTLKLCGSSL